MTDTMTPEQRRRCMAAVKSKDTKPELLVRKYLFSKGLRYRVNSHKLPGSPDIVLKKYGVVVFIDGCFWHGHDGCRYYKMPKSNVEFWERKINHNRARDVSNTAVLELMGWRVLHVWECQVRDKSTRESTLADLYQRIIGREADVPSIAAEPAPGYGK